ncbi:MAG: transketolase [Candidatus Moraniibacteriota bacterium]|nr:MAG: transketolase [Candidatus Moranbacteria bacterium]
MQHLEKINTLLRYAILNMTTVAGSGHPTSSLSAVELMSTLMYSGVFRFDREYIKNIYNDRLIFSKGHASPLYYALWAVGGAIDFGELENFRKIDSSLEGHPTKNFPFTEAATGSLGQGLSVGLGFALAQKKLDKTNARTFVLLGDGEMAEGQVWEAMQVATHYELDNLIAIVDVNRLGQCGETMIGHDVENYAEKARAFGWRAITVDGHNISEIYRIYHDVVGLNKKPLMIIAKTYKGKGISFLEDKYGWHGKTLSNEEFSDAVKELGEIDFDVRGKIQVPKEKNTEEAVKEEVVNFDSIDWQTELATRDGYGIGLEKIMQSDEKVIVLDAETSNSTRANQVQDKFSNRFFEMYIAEQNMISVAVGLSQAGYKPFASSFAAFLTRAHDQIRMASLNQSSLTITGSHCGVSIGADGSSQMGLGDIAMFRAILGSTVFYPMDAIATVKLADLARKNSGVTYMRTTREKTRNIYNREDDFSIGGSRIIFGDVTSEIAIIAAGITAHESLKAAELLKNEHVLVHVIDLYCVKPIDETMLLHMIGEASDVVVVEDHYREGGIYEAVCGAVGNLYDGKIHSLAVSCMPHSGEPRELLKYEEIDFNAIIKKIKMIHK